ncbi:type II secretion system protein [Kiritimatiella glycovorans]|uniref:Type II secretion system protein G n=1 Tax=Kiritimatiella glycovorans TaxID=1307763 RepID=A0A0G3EJ86_9BACT|nr:type II secretion system protein [Kiritimatiella glycovorans]AKJ64840.1 type II secretion system protein G [Kiritimatiella glycovorans]
MNKTRNALGSSRMTNDQSPMTARSASSGFTLIELLIVIGLLGALASLMLPLLKVDKEKSMESVVQSEMYDIQRTFIRFYNHCEFATGGPTNMADWAAVDLAPLLTQTDTNSPSLFSYEEWDLAKNRGWRGPYAVSEGTNAAGYRALLDPYGDPYEVVVSNDYPSAGFTNLFLYPSTNSGRFNAEKREELKRQLTFDE